MLPKYEINKVRAKARVLRYEELIKSGTSPSKGYGGVLIPYGVDENGDVIYKYNGELNHA